MSYDLMLAALDPGGDIDEVFSRIETEDTQPLPTAEQRDAFSAIAADVAAEGYEYTEGDLFVNIVNDNFGAVFDLRATGADVNVAYWHSGTEATAVMESVLGLVGRIQHLTGWTLFDPQRGEIVAELASLLPGSSQEMDRVTRWADDNIRGAKKPWWRFWG